MLRNFFALLAGLLIGSGLNMIVVQINMLMLFPAPVELDLSDPAEFNIYMAGLPAAAFAVAMFAHLLQSFVGGFITARLSGRYPLGMALLIGALSLIGGLNAMALIDGPDWMIAELPLYLVVAAFAGWLEVRRRSQRARKQA